MYLSLKEYSDFAEKLIKLKLGPNFVSDDAIGHVVFYLANADKNYKEDMETARSTWRMCYGLYGVKTLDRLKDKKKCLATYLKMNREQFSELIEDKRASIYKLPPITVKEIMSTVKLTESARNYIEHYLNGDRIKDIAEECNVTVQAVRKSLKNAIKKMRKKYGTSVVSV